MGFFDKVKEIRTKAPVPAPGSGAPALPPINAITGKLVDDVLGTKGQAKDGMFKVVIGRTAKAACGCAITKEMGLNTWAAGEDIEFDYSAIRPAGVPLKIKGGRASGPEPLRQMMNFARSRIMARQGSFLTSVDAHDITGAVTLVSTGASGAQGNGASTNPVRAMGAGDAPGPGGVEEEAEE